MCMELIKPWYETGVAVDNHRICMKKNVLATLHSYLPFYIPTSAFAARIVNLTFYCDFSHIVIHWRRQLAFIFIVSDKNNKLNVERASNGFTESYAFLRTTFICL